MRFGEIWSPGDLVEVTDNYKTQDLNLEIR